MVSRGGCAERRRDLGWNPPSARVADREQRRPLRRLDQKSRMSPFSFSFFLLFPLNRRGGDSNPRYSFPHTGFRNQLHQPLGHLSQSPFARRAPAHEPEACRNRRGAGPAHASRVSPRRGTRCYRIGRNRERAQPGRSKVCPCSMANGEVRWWTSHPWRPTAKRFGKGKEGSGRSRSLLAAVRNAS